VQGERDVQRIELDHGRGQSGWNGPIERRAPDHDRCRAMIERGTATSGTAIMTDATGKVPLVNAGVERLFGYRCDELLDQSLDILVPASARALHGGHRHLRQSHFLSTTFLMAIVER
jgi:hypothetical protein